MKKQHYLYLLMILSSLTFMRCGKDGAAGPTGPAGATGATGATGAVGAAGPTGANGQNGSVIYSGTVAPASTLGAVGDFYINLSTGTLFGPKTATGWGTGFSLKGANGATGATGATGSTGATGAAGAAGSQISSGSGAPATTLGKTGDYYLDNTNYLLYGPKTASGWGVPINLQGPAGPQGPAGNANVQTDVFTVNSTDWNSGGIYYVGVTSGVSSGYFTKYYDRANSLITSGLLGSGMVLVYFQSEPDYNTSQWQPLPYYFSYYAGYAYNWAYETSIGNVRLHFYLTEVTAAPPALSSVTLPTAKFKVVVVTGTLLGTIQQNHINLNNYADASRYLGLWQQDKQ